MTGAKEPNLAPQEVRGASTLELTAREANLHPVEDLLDRLAGHTDGHPQTMLVGRTEGAALEGRSLRVGERYNVLHGHLQPS